MSESARAHLLAKTDDKMTPFPLGPSAAIQKQPLAGSVLSEVLLATLKNQSIPVTPHYLVKTKEAVEPNQPARAQLRYVVSSRSGFLLSFFSFLALARGG